ncbi:HIT family protein [Novosphingobium aerophilum]|uniref:HIT family protein n=1 Tax=Novosphingobium aerophilum TaxID=2839843 RepID=UPI001BE48D5F
MIIPRRHVQTIFELYQAELNAIWDLVGKLKEALSTWDASIVGFNVGTNAGVAAGQTIGHAHIHLMPRRAGDMEDPRGGVRGVIPERQKY